MLFKLGFHRLELDNRFKTSVKVYYVTGMAMKSDVCDFDDNFNEVVIKIYQPRAVKVDVSLCYML